MIRKLKFLSHLRPVVSRSISFSHEYQDLGLYNEDFYGIWISNVYKFGTLMELVDQATNLVGINDSLFQNSSQKIEDQLSEILERIGIEEVIHRFGEKGVYLCFPDQTERDAAFDLINDVEKIGNIKSFNLYKVMGLPYIEDLIFRNRSTKLSVKNIGKNITEEDVFNFFRPYGKILEIDFSGGSAEIHYLKKKSAIDARCCLHRFSFEDNPIVVEFLKHHRIRVLLNHLKSPKLLPIFILLITFLLIILVEPIRLFNCARTLTIQSRTKKGKYKGEDYHRKVEAFRLSLDTSFPSIFCVTGNRGSGKSTFTNTTIHQRRFTTKIDFRDVKSREELINVFERSISYRPSFRTWNSIVRSIESLIPGSNTISNSEEQQLERILRTMEISLGFARMVAKDRKAVLVFDSVDSLRLKSGNGINEMMNQVLEWCQKIEEKGLAHIVFVCDDNFTKYHLQRSRSLGNRVQEIRVPTLSNDQILQMVLEKRNEYMVGIEDHNKKKVKKLRFLKLLRSYFKNRRNLQNNSRSKVDENEVMKYATISEDEIEDWKKLTQKLGGEDLNLLLEIVRRVGSERTVDSAYGRLRAEIKEEVLTRSFGDRMFEEESSVGWSKLLLWKTINKLVENEGQVGYEDLLYSVFCGRAGDVRNLVESKILTLSKDSEGKLLVRPFNKIVGEVFQEFVGDEGMKKKMTEFEARVLFERDLEIAAKVGKSCNIL